jgi:hypothetical protein
MNIFYYKSRLNSQRYRQMDVRHADYSRERQLGGQALAQVSEGQNLKNYRQGQKLTRMQGQAYRGWTRVVFVFIFVVQLKQGV